MTEQAVQIRRELAAADEAITLFRRAGAGQPGQFGAWFTGAQRTRAVLTAALPSGTTAR